MWYKNFKVVLGAWALKSHVVYKKLEDCFGCMGARKSCGIENLNVVSGLWALKSHVV